MEANVWRDIISELEVGRICVVIREHRLVQARPKRCLFGLHRPLSGRSLPLVTLYNVSKIGAIVFCYVLLDVVQLYFVIYFSMH